MSTASTAASRASRRPAQSKIRTGRWIGIGLALMALLVVVLGTKVVPQGQEAELAEGPAAFDKTTFGAEQFPAVQKGIAERAVPAPELAEAIAADPEAAAAEHAVEAAGQSVFCTTFTGTVKEGKGGIYEIAVDGMPEGVTVRVQTGPAINGTELRDATGQFDFSQFTNQIEFQDAGSALNEEMKTTVLDPVDPASLSGKTVTVTGAFTLINPEGWLVTPSALEIS
ncbi:MULTISPECIES: DUF2291 family protein [unclassified Brachybacterium]|uniref:DUF2291 family protein n=1 Tax=unclassified Brachybacterium TaxID=2623841 RepID=UPI00402AD4A2